MSDKVRIFMNTNITVSRGKYAAHAVHAALTAAGVHPGLPVVVLGGKPRDIEAMTTVIHDEGRTELEPGTLTAGTDWAPTMPVLMPIVGVDAGMSWRKANGTTGEYSGPLFELGQGIPRDLPDHGLRRALFDLAFGYVSGFPVRDILAFSARSLFPRPILEAEVAPSD